MTKWQMTSQGSVSCVVEGRLDVQQAGELRSSLAEARSQGAKEIELDLSKVDFMDSAGLAAVVSGLKQARSAGGELYLVKPSSQVKRILELTLLDKVIPQREESV